MHVNRRYRSGYTQSPAAILKRAAAKASVEMLEHRRLLSSVVINTTADQIDSSGPTVSLRDAIILANSSSSPTTITFDSTVFASHQTIVLSNSILELAAAQNVTITGPSAGVTINANNLSGVLDDESTAASVGISNLTLTGGGVTDYGGGLLHRSTDTLTLTNVTVTANTAEYDGGGIFNTGTLVIDNSSVTGNTVTNVSQSYGAGGGIDNAGGHLTVSNSTVSGNVDASVNAFGGGGICNIDSGTATIVDSTISGNSNYSTANGGENAPGGGIESSGTLVLTNSTVSGNTGSEGGGLDLANTTTLSDDTISANKATVGGGLWAATAVKIQNSVVSGNTALPSATNPVSDAYDTTAVNSQGFNLIGIKNGSTGWISSDITGTAAAPVSAGLGSLANNGGPTQTMLPQTGSQLIDAGSNSLIPSGVTTDQRGDARISNGTVDIGSVEVQSTPTITVTAASNQSATAGQSHTFALGSFTETAATAPYSVTVNWGDSSANTTFSMSAAGTITSQPHTYSAAATDTVTVTVTDASGTVTGSNTFSATVSQSSISVTAPSNQSAVVGQSASFSLGSFTPTNASGPYSITVAWGDGSSNTTFSQTTTGTITAQTHTFNAQATDTVMVSVTDTSGLITGSTTFTVAVSTAATPSITVTPPANQSATAGTSSSFSLGSFTATDVSGPFTVVIGWGDGSSNSTFSQSAAGTITAESHSFTTAATDTVTVTVTNSSGTVSNDATFTVAVSSATVPSIAVTPPTNQSATAGTSSSFALGSFTATDVSGPFTVVVGWGDGSGNSTFSQSAAGTITAESHAFTTSATDTVTVTVTNSSGTVSNDATFTVAVSSAVVPSIAVTPPANQSAVAGTSKSFALGSFTATDVSGPFTVVVGWGDGSGNSTFSQSAAGTITAESHSFTTAATNTVTVTVTNSSGTVSNDATFTATVSSTTVPSIAVTPPANQSAVAGISNSFALGSFTATDVSGPFTVVVAWGDGLGNSTFSQNTAGTLAPQAHTFGATGTETVTVTVTDSTGTVSNNATFTVNVSAMAVPTVTFTPPAAQTAIVGTSAAFNLGSFGATDAAGPYSVNVDWGDGSANTSFSAGSAGSLSTEPHTFSTTGTKSVTVTVTDSGDTASNQTTFTVTVSASTSSLHVNASAGSIAFDTPITLTATVTPAAATGTVTFFQNGVLLGTAAVATGGVATFSTTALVSGTDSITASYGGDSTYGPSTATSAVSVVVVPPANITSLSLQSSDATITGNEFVTLTATVSPSTTGSVVATGTVTFLQGNNVLGTGAVGAGGVATFTTTTGLPLGTDTLNAVYSGDVNFAASTSAGVGIKVTGGVSSATALTSSNLSKTVAQSVTFTATVASGATAPNTITSIYPTGTVTFRVNNNVVGTAAIGTGGVATFTTSAKFALGVDYATATYNGGSLFAGSNSDTFDLNVTSHALVPSIVNKYLPKAVIGGVKFRGGYMIVKLIDELSDPEYGNETGRFSVIIYASSTTTLNTTVDPVVATLLYKRRFDLHENKAIIQTIKIPTLPATLATGTYHLLLQSTDSRGNIEEMNTGATVNVTAPVISLSATFAQTLTASVLKKGAVVTILNAGNVIDLSKFTAVVGYSTDPAGQNIVASGTGIVRPVRTLIPVRKKNRVTVTGWQLLPAGTYYLTVTLTDATGHTAFAVSSTPI